MEIVYLGHSSFKIKTKNGTVVTDPYNPQYVGLKMPKVEADIITVSHDHEDHNFIEIVEGTEEREEPFVVSGPGEYEINQIFIFGLPSYHDDKKGRERGRNTIYIILADGLRICHLGDLGHSLSEKRIEALGEIDVLFVPTGGTYTLNSKEAVLAMNQIQPKVTIPMHYHLPGLKFSLSPVNQFLEEAGVEGEEKLAKFIVKPGDLPEEERKIIVLEKRD